ncbi:glycoside hydrolase family 105 protein [Lactarius akahatsu]|uniref:Glycoside hydrolase family 105 protein n=1 Tax=Lactarius akahatsu TaxID=416441 RepID=A0AAD4L356_9AGAM|nr:glycoside hydrolase family 105 protein [Lactarius akahatsu]
MYTSWFSFLALFFLVFVSAQGLTNNQVDTVKQLLAEGATHSWELGVRAQALLELSTPSFSVLTLSVPIPPRPSLNSILNDTLADVFTIARNAVAALPPPPTNGTGQPLVLGDGSAGDPASIGIAVLIANWTGLGGENYAAAATAQVEYLFGPAVPKTEDGAISHRVSEVQLWSDSVYMVPPFLAYYGIITGNQSMLQEAYNQVKLYRSYLSDTSAGGLWRHIVLGVNGTDQGHWSTGNAWAAAGMLRVLGTLKSSSFSRNFEGQIKDLGNWVAEIHSAMYPNLQANGLFKNYADGNSTDNFDDASSSALLAATVFRLALLTGNKKFVREAERTRAALFATNGTSAAAIGVPVVTSSTPQPSSTTPSSTASAPGSAATAASNAFADTPHFTVDGWLAPVVDPINYAIEGAQSPEGQAFTLMLESAWRDWSAAGSPGANVAPPSARVGLSTVLLGAVGLVVACTAMMMDSRAVLFSI